MIDHKLSHGLGAITLNVTALLLVYVHGVPSLVAPKPSLDPTGWLASLGLSTA